MTTAPPAPATLAVSLKPALMLVLATLTWSISFPLIKNWMHAVPADFPGGPPLAALALISLRMFAGSALIAICFPRLVRQVSAREFLTGLSIGLVNSVGTLLQVWGLNDQHTSPALSAFLTSLASPLVPLLGYLLFRVGVPRLTLLGLAFGMAGVIVLSRNEEGGVALHTGDVMTIGSAVVFAFVIIGLGHWGKNARPGHLAVGMLIGTGAPGLLLICMAGWLYPPCAGWPQSLYGMLLQPGAVLDLSLLIVLPTVLGTYCMSTYQPQVPASRAAVIYLLEPVFAALASLSWGHHEFLTNLAVGGLLILGGNLLAELPVLWRARLEKSAEDGK
jgi:drug/metabolite transporter (DMT)-like permease